MSVGGTVSTAALVAVAAGAGGCTVAVGAGRKHNRGAWVCSLGGR